MIFFYISLTVQVLIKHWNDSLFICDALNQIKLGRKPVSCSKSESTEWIFEQVKEKIVMIRTPNANAEVFDINMSNMELLLWPKHGGPNQQFTITKNEGSTLIKNGLMCLEYNPSTRSYIRANCNGTDVQKFEILPNDHKFTISEGPFTDAPGSLKSTKRDINNQFNFQPKFGSSREVIQSPQSVMSSSESKIIKSSSSRMSSSSKLVQLKAV
jgi:hypothetical protein